MWSKCLIHLRAALNIVQPDVREPIYVTADFTFFGCMVIYSAISIATIVTFNIRLDYKELFVDAFANISHIIVTSLVCNVTEMIKLCYKHYESMLEHAFMKNYADQYTISIIKNVKASYLEVTFATDRLVSVFGLTVALLYLRTIVAVVYCLVVIATGDSTPRLRLYSMLLVHSVLPIVISLCCDSAAKASEDLTDKCFELDVRTYTNGFVESEMESLKELLVTQKPNLTADGFFTTNRPTLLSAVSAAATYFIVFLQFWQAGIQNVN
ncbi:unnamed protein product [Acanthoscelides obtectus]|nr:unnamed protein product [Acanthoscelides obtectus]CAK1679169.1 hypothetical protein AOBTE_LOCUS32157 [Acanthoscelides obtectus]